MKAVYRALDVRRGGGRAVMVTLNRAPMWQARGTYLSGA
jgi:hypothetical protein